MSGYDARHDQETTQTFWLNSKVYDFLVWVAQIALPAAATFYITLGQLWDLPNPEKVAGTIIAFDAFLGVCLKIAQSSYNKSDARFDGSLNITQTPTRKVFELDLGDNTPEAIEEKDEFLLKVKPTE